MGHLDTLPRVVLGCPAKGAFGHHTQGGYLGTPTQGGVVVGATS